MDGIEFKISGLAELEDKLEHLPPVAAKRAIRQGLTDAPEVWAQEMADRARRYSGPDTGIPPGYLAEHIGMRVRVSGSGLAGSAHVGPERVDYPERGGNFRTEKNSKGREHQVGRIGVSNVAVYLEFGTRRSQAFPFIRPAFETGKAQVLEKFVADLKDSLNEAGLKLS